MRVAVAGGTGVVGGHVVASLERRGHEAVVLSRSRGVDLLTGRGLDEALTATDAVVDVSNVTTLNRRTAVDFFSRSAARLSEAEVRAGVRHHVVLSIVGVDRVDSGYYAGKLAQEAAVRDGPVPFTILRATQFHEFAAQVLDRTRGPVALVPRMRVQPVAAVEVGERLAALAEAPLAGGYVPELAGPEVHDLGRLARRVARARRRRRLVVTVPVPGAAGRAMSGGALLPRGETTLGTLTFDDWLAALAR
jgi:uncharacterized protein YbjT (DUF2867 family)